MRFHLFPLTVVVLLAACSSADDELETAGGSQPTKQEAKAILQASFNANRECTPYFDMPHDVPFDAQYDRQQLQAFVEAGLLRPAGEVRVTDPASGSGERRMARYEPTEAGQKEFGPGSGILSGQKTVICYGTRKIETVELGTPDVLGDRVSVTYRYHLDAVPAWARSPSIKAAYPSLETFLSVREEDHGSLVLRDGEWQLEESPSPSMFDFKRSGR
jgi:hypothetical protein